MSNTLPYQQRKDILRALKAARPLLWDGFAQDDLRDADAHKSNMHICHAISQARRDGAITEQWERAAKDLISKRLNYRSTLSLWLVDEAGIPTYDITITRLQAHRIAWVDHLIAEFSEPASRPDCK